VDEFGDAREPFIDECPDIEIQGMRADDIAVRRSLSSYNSGLYVFDEDFSNLDSLIVGYGFPSTFPAGVNYFGDPHFEADNLQLAPVPVPATTTVSIGGLLAFGLLGFLRKRRSALR